MTNHCKVYMKAFGYSQADFIPCECCGTKAVDIHHITGRGEGKDIPDNLMAVCRKCHSRAHEGDLTKGSMQYIHNYFALGYVKKLIR